MSKLESLEEALVLAFLSLLLASSVAADVVPLGTAVLALVALALLTGAAAIVVHHLSAEKP